MNSSANNPLATLALMDPDMAKAIAASLRKSLISFTDDTLTSVVEEILWGLSKEIHLGQAIAKGYADLVAQTDLNGLHQYQRLVRNAGKTGPSLGRVMAIYAPWVVAAGDATLLKKFEAVVEKLHERNLHAVPEPFDALIQLLKSQNVPTAHIFLKLILQSLSIKLPYNLARHNCHHIANALDVCCPPKQSWQLRQLLRVTETSPVLIEPFLIGMKQGLSLLSEENLAVFITTALEQGPASSTRIKDFLSLTTYSAQQAFKGLNTAVTLTEIHSLLTRYLSARIGRRIAVESIASLPEALVPGDPTPLVLSDHQSIYLPERMERAATYEENKQLYLCLAKVESTVIEFGTFDFDLEKFFAEYPDMGHQLPTNFSRESDLDIFFNLFSCPPLASDLFTIFEHGRLWVRMTRKYPGLTRKARPMLLQEAKAFYSDPSPEIRFALATALIFGKEVAIRMGASPDETKFEMILDQCGVLSSPDANAETSARLVFNNYSTISKMTTVESKGASSSYFPFQSVFGRRIVPALFHRACSHLSPAVENIKHYMHSKGLVMLRSDLRRELIQANGRLSKEGILTLVKHAADTAPPPLPVSEILSGLMDMMPDLIAEEISATENDGLPVFWHAEWDHRQADYLPRHVRVLERQLPDLSTNSYHEILTRYQPLVTTIRRAFERLKPESLSLLRYWLEGDEFDYRALLEVIVDKKAGRMPSDRLYIKRVKKERDVAVLLLVDLSGSTKNRVAGTEKSVLFLEKEAIVLFCEALEVIGDTFAIAGFSGHGRLGVDYYHIKGFDEPLNEQVQNKISSMTPQRSTRIGAAIRHAVSTLETISAKVRLLITLGDGYPNDLGYKGTYAVADTRKAIAEARFKGIHVRPITVNLDANENSDSLYDSLHHNIISDVQDLPNKLWRIYSDFTK